MSDDKRTMHPGLLLVIGFLACTGLSVLVKNITGSAEVAWITFVAAFAFLLLKGDDIFRTPSSREEP